MILFRYQSPKIYESTVVYGLRIFYRVIFIFYFYITLYLKLLACLVYNMRIR